MFQEDPNNPIGVLLGTEQPKEKAYKPSGMFGLKGTARDIIGTLGDALMVQSGLNPMYGPQRKQERLGQAMSGFNENPEEAIENLSRVDPEFASKVRDNYLKRQADAAKAAAEAAYKERDYGIKERKEGREDRKYGDTVLSTATKMAQRSTPENWPATRELMTRYLSAREVESPWDIPEQYDPEFVKNLVDFNVKPAERERIDNTETYRDESLQRRDRGLEIQEKGLGMRERGLDIREENTRADNERADKSLEEKGRSNRAREAGQKESRQIRRESASKRRAAPAKPKEGTVSTDGKFVYRNGKWTLKK